MFAKTVKELNEIIWEKKGSENDLRNGNQNKNLTALIAGGQQKAFFNINT